MDDYITIEDISAMNPAEISARFRAGGIPFPREVEDQVRAIVDDVARRGDAALFEHTIRFDGWDLSSPSVTARPSSGPGPRDPGSRSALESVPAGPRKGTLRVDGAQIEECSRGVAPAVSRALEVAVERVKRFHEREIEGDRFGGWTYIDELGNRVGKRTVPIERVGIYIPGGKASYPSTLVMTAVPALVAGVGEIALISPPASFAPPSPLCLAVKKIGGIADVFRVGGVQGIAALALGTETIRKVDKIVGPGNIYVAAAKKLLYGAVDIDMIAGPSEVLIIADGSVDPVLAAVDLMAQAEHDENARAVCVTWSKKHALDVRDALAGLLASSERREIVEKALRRSGRIYVVKDEECALALANGFGPEHLEIQTARPEDLLGGVRHAGAVFMGKNTAEAFGDYLAGPSHVLPTSGTARFFSPLSVLTFLKFSSVIEISDRGLGALGEHAACLAEAEGLHEHARSVAFRLKDKGKGRK
jgi:histidinol dehydrogenase